MKDRHARPISVPAERNATAASAGHSLDSDGKDVYLCRSLLYALQLSPQRERRDEERAGIALGSVEQTG
jgi:hypothetical protein